MGQQCALAARRAHHILGYVEHNIANRSKEVIYPNILRIGAAPPPALCAVLVSTVEGYKNIRMCPKEGNKDGERTRGHDL